jgi:hypothetical protein
MIKAKLLVGLVPAEGHKGGICPVFCPWLVDSGFLPLCLLCVFSMHVYFCVQMSPFYKDTS